MPPLLLAMALKVVLALVPLRILLWFLVGSLPWHDAQLEIYKDLPTEALDGAGAERSGSF